MDSLNHHSLDPSGEQRHFSRSDEMIDVPASLLPAVLAHVSTPRPWEYQGDATPLQRIPELVKALRNEAWYVRTDAVQQLGRFGEQAPLEFLLEALKDEHVSVRAAAVYALGQLGSRTPIDVLIHSLQDEEWQVRERSVLALSEQRDRIPIELLQAAIYDPDSNVRDTARYTLQSVPTAPLQRSEGELTDNAVQEVQPEIMATHERTAAQNNLFKTIFYRFSPTKNSIQLPTGVIPMLDPQQMSYHYPATSPAQGPKKLRTGMLTSALVAVATVTVLLFSILAVQHLRLQDSPVSGNSPTSKVGSGGVPAIPTAQIPSAAQTQHKPGDTLYTYADPYHIVYSVAWSPDDKRIVLADGGSVVSMDALTGAHKVRYIGNPDNLPGSIDTAVSWSPDGSRIAGSNSRLYVWDAATGNPVVSYQPPVVASSTPIKGNGAIVSTTWSPDSRLIAFATTGAPFGLNVYVWNIQSQQIIFSHPITTYSSNTSVSWSPDGKYLAFNMAGGTQIWDISQNRLVNQFPAAAFAWSPDSSRIAATNLNNPGIVSVWNLASGKELTHFQVVDMSNGALPVGPIAWSPDGKHLLVVSTDITEWDITTQTNQLHYTGHPFSYQSFPRYVSWSHNSRLVASAGGGQIGLASVKIWVPVE